MRAWLTALIVSGLTSLPAAAPHARSAPTGHAKVTLIADATTVAAGDPTWIGIRFVLDDGWHVYWRNPGESGTPPTVRWDLGDSTRRVGNLEFPVPERLVSNGDVSYGYRGEVVLLAPLRVETGGALGAQPGRSSDPALVRATVDYVICESVCVLEHASPSINIAGARAKQPAPDAPRLASWRARLPQPMPATWHATASLGTAEFTLTIETGHRETAATFFPQNPAEIDDGATAARVEPIGRGLILHLKKSAFFSKVPDALNGVVVLSGGSAFSVHAPLRGKIAPEAMFPRNYSGSNFFSEEAP